MLFNSYVFIFLMLPISILGYYQLNRTGRVKRGVAYILGLSLWFIGYMNIMYLAVVVPSILLNYVIAKKMNSSQTITNDIIRKRLLALGITLDVLILMVFKYTNFFVDSINRGLKLDIPTIKIILPLGISFYTFQQITYLVDCYRDSSISYGLLEYATYICFYPQFVQGPIVLQSEFIPQLLDNERKHIDYKNMSKGIYRFVLGLAKKVLIADSIAMIVDGGYIDVPGLNSISAVALILSYTLQIYFDFSGYSDMAIGIGWMFNIDLPENFASPYKARSIDEFWDRWHITLTRFFTKYVYIPLGGSRKGKARTYANVFFIFLISGLWHGAEWSFVLWGVMHGVAMLLKRALNDLKVSIPYVLETVCTFIFVNVAWVFFRAEDISQACQVLRQLVSGGFNGLINDMHEAFDKTVEGSILCHLDILGINEIYPGAIALIMLIACTIICFLCSNLAQKTADSIVDGVCVEWIPTRCNMIVTIILAVWCILSFSGIVNFVYWNF